MSGTVGFAQSDWPSENWATATNLTSAMSSSGIVELSGLHWNPDNKRLYAVQNDGRLRVLQYSESTSTFSQIGNKTLDGGPEGITQVDFAANEFYTIDENAYEIRKYTYNTSFSTVTEARHWDLLASPSPMEDTGNTGPEGIVFVPDPFLSQIGFTSPETGQAYVSTKGMGGLMFIAHQDGGYVWVFDLNPNVNNDFVYVGKFHTSRSESCDLAFDRSAGLLYILHNLDDNYLEVTDMTLAPAPGAEPTFSVTSEYFIANPASSNVNIEGFALMPKCGNLIGSAFLCRDVSSGEASSIRQDVLRWFDPFTADGDDCQLGIADADKTTFLVFPNPVKDELHWIIDSDEAHVVIRDVSGKMLMDSEVGAHGVSVSNLDNGTYFIEVRNGNSVQVAKFIKQ